MSEIQPANLEQEIAEALKMGLVPWARGSLRLWMFRVAVFA